MTSIPAGLQTGATNTVSSTAAGTDGSTTSKDYLDFLKLLTVQLKNQDPTNPMDTTQFTQQLIGFSQIQQQVQTNTNLKSLLDQNKSANVNSAVSYVDRFVQVESDKFNLSNNQAFISYDLPNAASKVTVSITDSTGKVVGNFAGKLAAGMNDFTWTGTGLNGEKLPDGKYNMSVTATDATGKNIDGIQTYTTDLVTAVDLENGETTLHLSDLSVSSDKVKSIKGYYSKGGDTTASTTPPATTTPSSPSA